MKLSPGARTAPTRGSAEMHAAITRQATTLPVHALLGVTILALDAGRVHGRVFADLALCLHEPGPPNWPEDLLRKWWAEAICRLVSSDPAIAAALAAFRR